MRQPCMYTGRASFTWLSQRRSTSGETPSRRCRQCGQVSAWNPAMISPAMSARPKRRFQSPGDTHARLNISALPISASDSHTGDRASHTAFQLSLDAKMRKQSAVAPPSVTA